MNLGDTFIWTAGGTKEHLYVVVTDPNKNGGRFVAFNFTRSTGGLKALTFQKGAHPFLTKYDSDINFGDGLIFSLTKLQGEILARRATPHLPMQTGDVQRIAELLRAAAPS